MARPLFRSTLAGKQERLARELSHFTNDLPAPTDHLPLDVRRSMEFIHEHLFDHDLNICRLKIECGVRNNNISTRFRASCGLGLKSYILRLRMEAAARLLAHDDIEVFLVAMAIGYEYPESFCRAFQRFHGCSPTDYRENFYQEFTSDEE